MRSTQLAPTRRDALRVSGGLAIGLAVASPTRAQPRPKKIAMIATSAATMPSGEPTGLWMSELTSPYWAFMDAGMDVVLASVAGGAPPIDPRSMTGPRGRGASVDRFEQSDTAMVQFRATGPVSSLEADALDGVFLCGGHGTMWDFRQSVALTALIERLYARGAIIAAVCHGPAGLLGANDPQGRPIVAGRRVTAFANAEEDAVRLAWKIPYLLETELVRLGARYVKVANFEPFAIRDGNLLTGQNPASAAPLAELVVTALSERTSRYGG